MTDQIITSLKKLRKISKPTTPQEVRELELVRRLREANKTAWTKGCGLAAIQIGIPLRFAWFKWGEQSFVLANPEIVSFHGSFKAKEEGCLSIPHTWIRKKRWYKIKYTMDGFGEKGRVYIAKNFKARIIQHEIDHMNGILNIDKAVKK